MTGPAQEKVNISIRIFASLNLHTALLYFAEMLLPVKKEQTTMNDRAVQELYESIKGRLSELIQEL